MSFKSIADRRTTHEGLRTKIGHKISPWAFGSGELKRCRLSIWLLWQLWPHTQHQNDRGGLSISTWQALQGAHHYSQRQVVDKFTYLGSTLTRVMHIDDEDNARIAKASAAFGRLRGSVWDESGIRLDTKLKVWCCQHFWMHAKRGQFTNDTPKDWTTSIQAALENFSRLSGKTGFQTQKSWKGQGCRVYILFWN